MASTNSLYTGLSGLTANARRLDVIGNNIANVNTTAFKSNRLEFAPTFSRNFSLGTAPGDTTGGTNPGQIGLGVTMAGTQRNFANGAISATGVATDVAIEGDGFFVAELAGERYFTRSGAFQRNQENDLVTLNGARVMGFGVDGQFNIVDGTLIPMNVPLGTLTIAEASRSVVFNGNLNASGQVATTGSEHRSRAFYSDAALTTLVNDASVDLTDPLVQLWIDDGAGGSYLALQGGEPGPTITIEGIEKAGKDIGRHVFQFTAGPAGAGVDATGTTLQDYLDWLGPVLGLSDATINGQTLGGGVSFDGGTGEIVIRGNEGTVQGLGIATGDFVVTTNGAGISSPFVMTQTAAADGESVRTSFVVYDSLGTPITVDLSFVLQETVPGTGTIWTFIAESTANAAPTSVIGLGVVEFDSSGRFATSSNLSFSIARDNGAVSPLSVSMAFDSGTDAITALTDSASNLAAVYQDGSPIGTLSAFSIGADGILTGAFTNGLTRPIGQIVLGKFANPEGLVDVGGGLFRTGPNSGTPIIARPLDFGTGRVIGGALELSNVDLSQEFINMILTSTGYSASSRIISTTNELMNQLLVLGR
ncbi:MAG: flagellar hook-basal body complex protein [Phycisphaeraceae bacterium]|nr:flagellar hook-basal body complex protein [Phycisphaeraceae bacterium]